MTAGGNPPSLLRSKLSATSLCVARPRSTQHRSEFCQLAPQESQVLKSRLRNRPAVASRGFEQDAEPFHMLRRQMSCDHFMHMGCHIKSPDGPPLAPAELAPRIDARRPGGSAGTM